MEDDMAGREERMGEVRTKFWSGCWREDASFKT